MVHDFAYQSTSESASVFGIRSNEAINVVTPSTNGVNVVDQGSGSDADGGGGSLRHSTHSSESGKSKE